MPASIGSGRHDAAAGPAPSTTDPLPAADGVEVEVERLLNARAFRKSPVLMRLLEFLCQETLAGRGAALKSYAVAVDGLGRAADFDPQTDSYPRVQVGRLRKLIETHYAQTDRASAMCLAIPTGSYALVLLPRSVAYPNLPQSEPSASCAIDGALPRGGRNVLFDRLFRLSPLLVLLVLILVSLAAGLVASLHWPNSSAPPRLVQVATSPFLFVEPTGHGPDDGTQIMAQAAYDRLLDGLSKSWVVRVRTPEGGGIGEERQQAYRLETQVSPQHALYVRLFDQASGILVWAHEFAIAPGPSGLGDAVDAVAARIAGTYGVVAVREAERIGQPASPGFACILAYFRHAGNRDQTLRPILERCLEQPSPEPRLEPARQAARAMFVLDIPPSQGDRLKRVVAAQQDAEAIAIAYPDDYLTHFAAARLSFARLDCAGGSRHASQAIAVNANDPLIDGALAILMHFCGVPDRMGLTDRVMRFQVEGDLSARLTTILLSIATGRRDRLTMLAALPLPSTGENAAFSHLCNTLLFAALDRRDEAVASWEAYRTALNGKGRSDSDLLGQFFVADLTRMRVEAFLRAKRVI